MKIGEIGWLDLTVDQADSVADFYSAVVGWEKSQVPVDDYHDFCMLAPASPSSEQTDNATDPETPIAGVCHRRGVNADIPPQWLVYIVVADLAASLLTTEQQGGQVIAPARSAGGGKMAVISDPAGAVLALFESTGD